MVVEGVDISDVGLPELLEAEVVVVASLSVALAVVMSELEDVRRDPVSVSED